MQNGLNANVEVRDSIGNAHAAVQFVWKWDDKGQPAVTAPYSKEITELAAAGLINGKLATASIHLINGTPARLIVIGLGEKEKQTAETYRAAGGALARLIAKHPLDSVAVLPTAYPADVITGLILAGYEYTDYKGTGSRGSKPFTAVKVRLVGNFSSQQRADIESAVVIAESQNYARTIASRPGNDINPPSLAKVAEQLAKDVGLGFSVLDEKKMKQMGMGGMIGVGAGSNATPPRMITLEYNPKNKKLTNAAPLLVIGKAITFDTGGISIKQAPGMQRMVFDKCGGMAVLGMMRAIALLKLPIRVIGILASAENHISETAYRPGDILKMYNGITVEVISTDAEGRLVLGDALAWGIEKYKPAAVVNLATLTGGVVIALGKSMAGLMSNNDHIVAELQSASNSTGEKIWRLPIGDEHREALKSNSADICNSGPREASPLIAGAFLSFFVPGHVPWAHLDIAGVAAIENPLPYYGKGATGWGVRTLVEWVKARAADGKIKGT